MNSLQCLKHEWLCQTNKTEKEEVKNNQEDHSSSGRKDPELNTTKHNLSQSKGQYDPAHDYVRFDCETRTMSRADPRDDDNNEIERDNNHTNQSPEKDEKDKENKEINESKEVNRISQTSISSTTHDNNLSDCRKRLADGKDNDYLEATIGYRKRSKTPLVDEDESNGLIHASIQNTPSTVITYDQVQRRANEIREGKRMSGVSFDSLEDSCSIVMKSKEQMNMNEVDDLSANADDEDTTTEGGPTPTLDISEISIPCIPGEFNLENPTVTKLPTTNAYSILSKREVDVQNPKNFSELSEQTLWQATEGTITPLWEVANLGESPSLGN